MSDEQDDGMNLIPMTLGTTTAVGMAVRYGFRCTRCGYEKESFGGRAEGFAFLTVTVNCKDCGELHDVPVVRGRPNWSMSADELDRTLVCPRNARHRVVRWEHPGPCPFCCGRMVRGPAMTFID